MYLLLICMDRNKDGKHTVLIQFVQYGLINSGPKVV